MKFNSLQLIDQNASPTGVGLLAPEGTYTVGSLFTHSDAGNQYNYAYSTSGPWTTLNSYNAYTDNSLIQWINIALGDGWGNNPGSNIVSGMFHFGDSQREISRNIQWSNGSRIGHLRDSGWQGTNQTSYGGNSFRMMPIRNITEFPITTTVYASGSSSGTSSNTSPCLFYLIPNTSTYSTTTVVSSALISRSSTVNTIVNLSGNITIPANTTIILCLAASEYYFTTSRFMDASEFYNLQNIFTPKSGLICDMRMLTSLQNSRFNLPYNVSASGTSALAPLWTVTALNYGDR